jgi:hypothetical protein
MRELNKTFISYFLPAISVICLMGCVSFTPYRTSLLGTNPVFNKDYELNVKKTAYVGNQMISIKNYHLSRFNAKAISPNIDLTIKYGRFNQTYYALDEYAIVGEAVIKKKNYHLISILPLEPNSDLLLISENGEVGGRSLILNLYFRYYQMNWFKYKILPSGAKFIMKEDTKIDTSQGYENYELIYTGKDKEAIHITYREYSPDDLARTAFFQNLTYPADAKVIRFKGFKILVDEATSESITFKVVEEG